MKRDLGALAAREHDVLVVGGGIYGAASAWDAAQRGLRTALAEARDFGSGASWNSLKTIHGGLRHLQRGDVGLVRQSMRERRALLRIAPELVRSLPVLAPTYGHGPKGREAFALGLFLNDVVTSDRNDGLPAAQHIPPGRMLSPAEVLALVPGLPAHGLTGGAAWHDAQVASSERLLIAFLHAAAGAGAVVVNRAEVTGLLRDGPRVRGARVRDLEGGGEMDVRAQVVLNAAGPAMDGIRRLAGIERLAVPLLRGLNLLVPRPLVGTHALGAQSGGRFLFMAPWREGTIVGTAYEPAEAPITRDDAAGFLEEVNRAYPWLHLQADDVTLAHRGLVPGTGGAEGLWTRHLLIDHEREDGVAGLVSVLGVKYTTARGVAEQAMDLVFRRLGRTSPPCRTADTPLSEARPLTGSLEEGARRAVREEMALHLSDAVLRRLDLGTLGPPPPAALDVVARTMATELGWDEAQLCAERLELARAYSGHAFTWDGEPPALPGDARAVHH